MSSLFNQTNIAPGTTFSGGGGGGGGSNFPQGVAISDNYASTRVMAIGSTELWGQDILSVYDGNKNFFAPVLASRLISKAQTPGVPTTQKTGDFGAESIVFQGNNGAGNSVAFLNVNDSALVSLQSALPFQMAGVSSMQSGTFIINAEKMCSTMKGYGWA